jgi:inorganic pyrophosphatase/exopolyphosphatase
MIDMTEKMLAAKSNVSAVDDETLVLLDSKQYNFGLGYVLYSLICVRNWWSYLVTLATRHSSDTHCCLAHNTARPFRVSVIETTDAAPLVARRLGLVKAANEVAHAQGLSGVLIFVVDILGESAIFLNEDLKLRRRIAAEFKQPLPTGGAEPLRLPGVLSRKKQIVPALERALSTTFIDEA